MGVGFSIVTSELALGSNTDDQLLAELEARLTAADDELKRQDQLIRGESAADKLIVEGKLSGDLNKQETDFRSHFNNEIFNMDTKFTTSINGKLHSYCSSFILLPNRFLKSIPSADGEGTRRR